MAVELARRSIPSGVRPTFQEMEGACRGGGGVASKAAYNGSGSSNSGAAAASAEDHRHQAQEGRPWRPPRRRLEGGLCGLRDRDDGAVHRALADERGQEGASRRSAPSSTIRPGPGKLTGTAAAGLGNAIEVPKDDMKKLAEKIQQALLSVPNFRNLKDHVEITITSDGLRIELLETEAGMFFESGRAQPTETGSRATGTAGSGTGQTAEQPADRRAHRCQALLERRRVFQLGAIHRPGQCGAQADGRQRRARSDQVAQVRGFAERQSAASGGSRSGEQSPDLGDRAVSDAPVRKRRPKRQLPKRRASEEGRGAQEIASEKPALAEKELVAVARPRDRRTWSQAYGTAYMYSGIGMPSTPAVRSNCRRKKSVIHSRKTFFSRFSSWMMGYRS